MAAMVSRMTSAPVPLGQHVPDADQIVVMSGVDWAGYEALLALRGERSRPKLAYLDGVVELMSTSRGHEGVKSSIGCLVEAYCLEVGIDFSPYGNWTQKQQLEEAGCEPDECYIFGPDPKTIEWPQLAIEIVWTRGGIDKLEIYRRLGIGEVWFWDSDTLAVYVLGKRRHERRERSACLPGLDLAMICRIAQVEPTSAAIRQLREELRAGAAR